MSGRLAEGGLWLLSLALLLGTAAKTVGVKREHLTSPPLPVLPSPNHAGPTEDELLDAVGDIRDGNLFRADRAPADPASAPPAVGPPQPVVPRPQLVVRGLVGGPPWSAIVEGIPGSDGATVMRIGQASGGIVLQSVRRDTIILKGRDTTWKLTVARAW